MRERLHEIISRTCDDLGAHIGCGVLARNHTRKFLSIPPKLSLSDVMQRIKTRSARRITLEFPDLHKHYWGRRFGALGYFFITTDNVIDILLQYLELPLAK